MGDHEAPEEPSLLQRLHDAVLGEDETHPDDQPKLTDEEWGYVLAVTGEGSD